MRAPSRARARSTAGRVYRIRSGAHQHSGAWCTVENIWAGTPEETVGHGAQLSALGTVDPVGCRNLVLACCWCWMVVLACFLIHSNSAIIVIHVAYICRRWRPINPAVIANRSEASSILQAASHVAQGQRQRRHRN